MELVIVFWVIFALLGAAVGSTKGRGGFGFVLGLMLGPIGVLIVALLQGNRTRCPDCKTLIHNEAVVCSSCGRKIQAELCNNSGQNGREATTPNSPIIATYDQWLASEFKRDPANRYSEKSDLRKKYSDYMNLELSKVSSNKSKPSVQEVEPNEITNTIAQRLIKLRALLDEGHISQQDFENRKESILKEV
jgi:hypothetical protein